MLHTCAIATWRAIVACFDDEGSIHEGGTAVVLANSVKLEKSARILGCQNLHITQQVSMRELSCTARLAHFLHVLQPWAVGCPKSCILVHVHRSPYYSNTRLLTIYHNPNLNFGNSTCRYYFAIDNIYQKTLLSASRTQEVLTAHTFQSIL